MEGENSPYLMEHGEEILRLEMKTDPEVLRKQACWCGVAPGLRVLDAGCGPGKTSAILHGMVLPEGRVLGVDASPERIRHAEARYGGDGLSFLVHDWATPLQDVEPFDLIWVRFVLEYNRRGSFRIVRNLSDCLRPGGTLCLMDLDHNGLNHYELPREMEAVIKELMGRLERDHDFDPYAGRKLYAHLYDLGYEEIEVALTAHHLIYGPLREEDAFNWIKKLEVVSSKTAQVLDRYPGGRERFMSDFKTFFTHPRRFTYTPLISCKGVKPG
ncbi:MAG: methyltransferase domain-containing protein [Deltaproteobacteria bacterium]|nr:methyltransferase domain-containing protein [Deltaproteobacteria bacterium]